MVMLVIVVVDFLIAFHVVLATIFQNIDAPGVGIQLIAMPTSSCLHARDDSNSG